MTNGDKIRKMTNGQISETLVFVDICSMCTGADSVYCGEPDFCKHSIEEWLELEAIEDDIQ
jgi:hypothetical protein